MAPRTSVTEYTLTAPECATPERSDVGWPPYMTTARAARYCGFKTTGGLRKAAREGRIKPAGRRGGSGTWMWSREELDAFSAAVDSPPDAPVRLRRKETNMGEIRWIRRWNSWITPTKLPGVFRLKEGGYLVRGRTKDPATGKDKEIRKTIEATSETAALQWLEDELARVRSGASPGRQRKVRFADYAVSLAERKLAAREIRSARGRERWKYTLDHLIGGTEDVTGFGELFIDEIRPAHVEAWRTGSRG